MLYSLTLWAHGKPSKNFFAHHGDTSFIRHLKYSNTFTAYILPTGLLHLWVLWVCDPNIHSHLSGFTTALHVIHCILD